MAGDNVTWIDFYFWELVNLMKFCHEGLLEEFPSMKSYDDTMRNLPKVKEYLDDPNSLDNNRPFNNKVAKINSVV